MVRSPEKRNPFIVFVEFIGSVEFAGLAKFRIASTRNKLQATS